MYAMTVKVLKMKNPRDECGNEVKGIVALYLQAIQADLRKRMSLPETAPGQHCGYQGLGSRGWQLCFCTTGRARLCSASWQLSTSARPRR